MARFRAPAFLASLAGTEGPRHLDSDFEMVQDAFRRFALNGHSSSQVAEELGLSENAVVHAKSRILKRLRQEAGELLG